MLAALLLMASVLTVDQVVARHGELNGQVIEVQGLLPHCADEDCALWSKPGPIKAGWGGHLLAIPRTVFFDRLAAPYVGHEVILTARLNDKCLTRRFICFDRADDLTPAGDHPLRLLGAH